MERLGFSPEPLASSPCPVRVKVIYRKPSGPGLEIIILTFDSKATIRHLVTLFRQPNKSAEMYNYLALSE